MLSILTILLFLILLPLTLFVLVPVGFALTSVGNLLTLPTQVVAVALDRRRRRNHALEHATVNVLEQRYGARLPLGGLAEEDGFSIQGAAQPAMVLAAAEEGLRRLQAGEVQLALHRRCGTVLVAGQLISAVAFFITLIALGGLSIFNLLFAMLVAILAARSLAEPVGLFLQRTLTTSTDVHGLHVDRLDAEMPKHPFALILSGGQPTQFRIWTHEVKIETPSAPKRYKAY